MRYLEEKIVKILMICSILAVLGSLLFILFITISRGWISINENPGIIFTTPGPRYLLGGEGGFFHAIAGSLYMVVPSTIISLILACLIALFLQSEYSSKRISEIIRLFIDILWGTPSIIYGLFVLTILISFHRRGCLLAGIVALIFLELPIITRYVDESISSTPKELKEIAYSMGLTRVEVSKIILKYSSSGIIAGSLIGLGRAFGDAASIIFTTGAASTMPKGLFSSCTALPVVIFQQANSFYPSVRNHAYAAAFILIIIILILSITSRLLQKKFSKYTVGD